MNNLIDKLKQITHLQKYTIIYYVLLPVTLCLLFGSLAFSDDLWLDEIYTITEIHLESWEIWTIFATESHPPLYIYLLKLFCTVFGGSILAMKFFSVLGCLATMLLGAFPIKRAFGDKTALWFMFLCLTMPFMLHYSIEIRMYSWAIFFVTATMIYAVLILQTNKPMDWGLYFVFGLLGAYTHYYALMTIAIIHLLLGFYLWFTSRKNCIPWLIISGLLIISYLPWVMNLLSQVSRVSEGFWIAPLSFMDIIVMPASMFYMGSIFPSIVLLAILTIFGCAMLYRILRTSPKGFPEKIALACIIVPLVVYAMFIIFSITIQPIIQTRYLMVMAGLGMLFLAICLSSIQSKKLLTVFCALMMVTTLITYGITYSTEYPTDGDSLTIMSKKLSQNISDDCILLYTEGHAYGVLSYYLPNITHWMLVDDEEIADIRSSHTGKFNGFIVGVDDVYAVSDSGQDMRLITFGATELPDLITDNFNVVEERRYTSTSSIYPVWCVSSIERLPVSS
ncbi:MAG: glycosyltransferase family 39 protein [Methanocorpusculum sp.]|nr:glycosyltransferase family 39 protein [Methanocorpusculum sp.]